MSALRVWVLLLIGTFGTFDLLPVAASATPPEKAQSTAPVPKLSAEPKPPTPAPPPAAPVPPAASAPPVSSPPALPAPTTPPAPTGTPGSPAPKPESVPEKDSAKKSLGSLILTIKLALLADARLFQYDIDVEEDQHNATLLGRVTSEELVGAAGEIVRAVPGVHTVVNKLQVDKALGPAMAKKQDEIITGLVKERFAKSATLKAANFEVTTEDGVVSLNGSVRFQVIALEAAETARHVPGVRAVKTQRIRLEGEG